VCGMTGTFLMDYILIQETENQRRKNRTDPVRSPTMPGGLLAIRRDWFWESGSYDDKMEIWGGENIEMSVRIWTCGGSIEFIPCSRVGHIFRSTHPYGFPSKTRDYTGLNTKRFVDVWLDEYARLYYQRRPDLKDVDVGDLSERKALRKDLNCKPFKWFLENIYPEKFIPDENVYAYGKIQFKDTKDCIDLMDTSGASMHPVGVYGCHYEFTGTTQFFSYTKYKELRTEKMCLDVNSDREDKIIMTYPCHGQRGKQEWDWNPETFQLRNSYLNLCMEGDRTNHKLIFVRTCDQSIERQKFQFQTLLETPVL